MAQYSNIAPVTLTFTVSLDGVTPGGKCRAVEDSVVVVGASGPGAEHFNIVVTKWGDLLALDTRLAKGREDRKPAVPAPAPAKAPAKGKAKVAVAPAPAPAMDIQAMIQAEIQKALAALTGK